MTRSRLADSRSMLSLLSKAYLVNLTNVASSQEVCFRLVVQWRNSEYSALLYLVNKDIDANELAVKTTFLNPGFSASKISLLVLRNRISLSLTSTFIPSLDFLKLIQQKSLHKKALSTFIRSGWPLHSRLLNPLDVPTETELFGILSEFTAVTQLKLYWKHDCASKSKTIASDLWQVYCHAWWVGTLDFKPWWICWLFLAVMSVLMVVWRTWKCLMKSMPAQLKLKQMSMVSKNHGFLCSKMKRTPNGLNHWWSGYIGENIRIPLSGRHTLRIRHAHQGAGDTCPIFRNQLVNSLFSQCDLNSGSRLFSGKGNQIGLANNLCS